MQAKRGTFALVVMGLVVGCGSIWQTAHLRAADPTSERWRRFGMIGIAAGQTARLNVVFADPPSESDPPGELVPAVCPAELQFFDSEGLPIGHADVRLMRGQARYLDLRKAPGSGGSTRAGAQPPEPDRWQIRASWRATNPPDPDHRACSRLLIGTVEVFGPNGATLFVYPGLADPPDPDLVPLR